MTRPRSVTSRFCLYIAAGTQNSETARTNLTALCNRYLPDHEIEVVDVLREPERAADAGILMTPTLVKLSPGPIRRIIGTLNQTQRVLQALDVEGATE